MLVVSRETCPSQARMVLMSTPARSRCVAVVCRLFNAQSRRQNVLEHILCASGASTGLCGGQRATAVPTAAPSHAPSKDQKPGGLWRSPRWAGSIIGTNVAPPERTDVELSHSNKLFRFRFLGRAVSPPRAVPIPETQTDNKVAWLIRVCVDEPLASGPWRPRVLNRKTGRSSGRARQIRERQLTRGCGCFRFVPRRLPLV